VELEDSEGSPGKNGCIPPVDVERDLFWRDLTRRDDMQSKQAVVVCTEGEQSLMIADLKG